MKKIVSILFAIALMAALCACGSENSDAEATQVGMVNPWRDSSLEEVREKLDPPFRAPEGAEDENWRLMESAEGDLAELRFVWEGLDFIARAKKTENLEDISGMYYPWSEETDFRLQNGAEGKLYLLRDETGTKELCTWYDHGSNTSCSLSVSAEDLDGFDLIAVAEAITWEQLPPDTRPVPSAEQLADDYFRVGGSYHPGTAGSSLARAQALCEILRFARDFELSKAHVPSLRHNMLSAWESLREEERGWFDENFMDLVELAAGAQSDWTLHRPQFEDVDMAEEMETLLNDPEAMASWSVLRDNTLTLGNSEN